MWCQLPGFLFLVGFSPAEEFRECLARVGGWRSWLPQLAGSHGDKHV